MALSRKNYIEVAGIIDRVRIQHAVGSPLDDWDKGHQCAVEDLVVQLAAYFKADNPAFDARRFNAACFTNEPAK